jgi:ABC-type uncharacterized transport system involved in gliding motility auxiliary subunit
VALMKAEWRRFAPLGLYLSLLAALTSGVLYLLQGEWNLYLQTSLAFILVGLALFAVLDPERVRVALTGRQARYGSNALVLSLAFAGILVVVNYLAYQNPKRWDLTEDSTRTLLPETIEALRAVPEPVEALAFYPAGINTERAQTLLDDYKYYSGGNFDYRFIDPVADPIAARQANVALEASGTIVLGMGGRQEKVTFPSEQELTGAVVRLMSEEVAVYFLTGHGEYSPEEFGDQSYSQLKGTLESKNYRVDMLNLLSANEIPADAGLIVIAGPQKPLDAQEIDLLRSFTEAGGALVVLLEPSLLTDFGDQPDTLAAYLAAEWGVVLGDDIVVDMSSNQPYQAFAAQYDSLHPITGRMQRLGTAFPTARSVQIDAGVEGVERTTLVFTGPQSWAETDLDSVEAGLQVQPDGADLIGTVPLAVAAERTFAGSRLVVFGDADFAIDVNYAYLGNGDLLINSIDWAAEQENLINLTPRTPTSRLLAPPQTLTRGLILLGAVIVPVGLVLFGGIATWASRRKRG